MKFSTTLLSLAIASSAALAPTAFAQSADLSVSGRIFPGACAIDLGNGGIVDLGDIRSDLLKDDSFTVLPLQRLPISIGCESKVRFALETVDNAKASALDGVNFGIGVTAAEEKIGYATIRLEGTTIDGAYAYTTRSADNGNSWSTSTHESLVDLAPTSLMGFALSQDAVTGPDPIEQLQADVRVSAWIRPASELTLADDVPISGSATINLVYL